MAQLCSCGNPVPYFNRAQCFACRPKGVQREGVPARQQRRDHYSSREEIAQILELVRLHPDKTYKEIALIQGCSLDVVAGIAKRNGLAHGRKGCGGRPRVTHLCSCGAHLPRVRRYSEHSGSGQCFICWPKSQHAHGSKDITLVCGTCEKEFTCSRSLINRRIRQKQRIARAHGITVDDTLYCSNSCGAEAKGDRYSNSNGSLSRFKRRPWWSDEQWHWEKKLVELGLGMQVACDPDRFVWGDKALAVADALNVERSREGKRS